MHKSITSSIYISDLSNSMEMEEQKDYLSPNNGVPTNNTGSSRWNPTKEQIAMLESLYKQGLRTPSAEQIQNITGKLREFGSIEGKNVFYWFQNHKARQRQKHKQQSFAYYTRLLRKSPVVLSPPPLMPPPFNPSFSPPLPCNQAGVIYRPFIQQANGQNYYTQAQHPAMFYADQAFNKNGPSPGFQRTGRTENPNPGSSVPCKGKSVKMTRETLQLFPLHPSNRRLSDSEKAGIGLPSGSASVESFENCNGDEGEEEVENQNQFLIDFLGALNGSS